jgi:RNA polymerase sigma-70 factor, ECF subfamily
MDPVVDQVDRDPGQTAVGYRPQIYRYLLSMARDPDTAEDLTQETFLRALRSLGGLREPAALVSWLYRLATNVFLDWVRGDRRRTFAPAGRPDGDGGDPLEEIPDPAARVDRLTEQAEMSGCVRRHLDELPDEYRAAVLLHDAFGLSSREIADLIDISVPTAKIRIHRGRARLRTALEEGCEFEIDDRGVTVCDPAR